MTKGMPSGPEPEWPIREVPAVAPVSQAVRPVKPPRGAAATILWGLANLLFVGVVVYLTYFFTMFFSTRPPAPAAVPEEDRVAAKKIEERKAEDRKLLTTYGPVDATTKTLRLPIDRGMDLVVAESAQPAPAVAPATPAPAPPAASPNPEATATVPSKPEATATAAAKSEGPAPAAPKPETAASQPATAAPQPAMAVAVAPPATTPSAAPAPARPPARGGLSPAQLYKAVCVACHDTDGRGSIVRKAMPLIPDLTDRKWQATRTDAELLHSVLEGKGLLMLPMKDKFALARIDPKEMVAFMRGFQTGGPVVAPRTNPQPSTPQPAAAAAVAPQPATTTVPQPPTTAPPQPAVTTASQPPPTAPPQPAPIANASASPTAPSSPTLPSSPPTPPPPTPTSSASALALEEPLSPDALALLAPTPPPAPSGPGHAAAMSPEAAAKLRAAGMVYQINCMVCHGPDGRGTLIRPAMPPIPDFTTREWQTGKDSAQLSVSILDGKGTLMPPWRGKLTNDQARDLAAYVRSLGPADLANAEMPVTEFGNRYRELRKRWNDLTEQARLLATPLK
jgi:mono/diheme cytochrome c family protein